MKDEKIDGAVRRMHELVKQSINAIQRTSHDTERLYDALHLSDSTKSDCEAATPSPNPIRGSIEELEYDVQHLRSQVDSLEGRLHRNIDNLLGEN